MKRTSLNAEYTTVATFSAALVIAILSWLTKYIPLDSEILGVTLRGLTATGTYLLLFKILLFLYFKIFWKVIHQREYLGGDWKYAYNDSFNKDTGQYEKPDGYGFARIHHESEEVIILGESYTDVQDKPVQISSYKGSGFAVIDDRLELLMDFIGRAGNGNGYMVIDVITAPRKWWQLIAPLPKEIVGFYYLVGTVIKGNNGWIKFERVI